MGTSLLMMMSLHSLHHMQTHSLSGPTLPVSSASMILSLQPSKTSKTIPSQWLKHNLTLTGPAGKKQWIARSSPWSIVRHGTQSHAHLPKTSSVANGCSDLNDGEMAALTSTRLIL